MPSNQIRCQSDQCRLLGEYVNYTIFVTYFFSSSNLGARYLNIFYQNSLNDVDSPIDVPFAAESKLFQMLPQVPKTAKNMELLGLNLENFCLNSPLTLAVSKVNTPYKCYSE